LIFEPVNRFKHHSTPDHFHLQIGSVLLPLGRFLNTLQHKALLIEIVSAANASSSSSDKSDDDHLARRRGRGVLTITALVAMAVQVA
jgi:hypothetical protein